MRRYTEGLRETIDGSHVAYRFTVRLAYYQILLIDETEIGMRPGQCGMCWSMRFRGGRLATVVECVVVPSHLTYFQYDHMSLYGQALV